MGAEKCGIETGGSSNSFHSVAKLGHSDVCVGLGVTKERGRRITHIYRKKGIQLRHCIHKRTARVKLNSGLGEGGNICEGGALGLTNEQPFRSVAETHEVTTTGKVLKSLGLIILKAAFAAAQQSGKARGTESTAILILRRASASLTED